MFYVIRTRTIQGGETHKIAVSRMKGGRNCGPEPQESFEILRQCALHCLPETFLSDSGPAMQIFGGLLYFR
jgi:hypothetical protein